MPKIRTIRASHVDNIEQCDAADSFLTAVVHLKLYGDLPCKKNQLRAKIGGGGVAIRKDVKVLLDAIHDQARIQWGARPRVSPSRVEIRMFVLNDRKDQDGIWTSVLDCLTKARVIRDDAIREYNPVEVKHPAELVSTLRDERIEIAITYHKGGLT